MTRFKLFLQWARKAWPMLWILLIVILHISISSIPNIDNVLVNEIIGMVLPFIGVFFILYSINEDFQDFRNSTMLSSFKEYLKSCPLKKQRYALIAEPIILSMTLGKAYLSEKRMWSTTEEGLKELERRIEDLREHVNNVCKDTDEEMAKLRSELEALHGKNKEEITQVRHQLDLSVMGKVNHQIFGALLIVYGFVVNISVLLTRSY